MTPWRIALLIVGSAVGLLVIVYIIGVSTGGASPASSSARPCAEFRAAMTGAAEGILTAQEMRDRMQVVYRDSASATPAVQRDSMGMLRDVTGMAPDNMAYLVALFPDFSRMDADCKAVGH